MGMDLSSIDNLAANGILNFDADAYVKGTPARYVGKPPGYSVDLPFDQPLMSPFGMYPGAMYSGPIMAGQPSADAFIAKKHEKPFTTKEIVLGALAVGAGALIISKSKSAVAALKKIKLPSIFKSAETKAKEAAEAAKALAEKAAADGKAATKSGILKWAKRLGGAGAALAALFVGFSAFRLFTKPKAKQMSPEQMAQLSQQLGPAQDPTAQQGAAQAQQPQEVPIAQQVTEPQSVQQAQSQVQAQPIPEVQPVKPA